MTQNGDMWKPYIVYCDRYKQTTGFVEEGGGASFRFISTRIETRKDRRKQPALKTEILKKKWVTL